MFLVAYFNTVVQETLRHLYLENIGVGRVIDDILLVALCYAPEEITSQVIFIPF